jgi:hypothetical protein
MFIKRGPSCFSVVFLSFNSPSRSSITAGMATFPSCFLVFILSMLRVEPVYVADGGGGAGANFNKWDMRVALPVYFGSMFREDYLI